MTGSSLAGQSHPSQHINSVAVPPAPAVPVSPMEAEHLFVNGPVNIRSVSLALLALFAGLFVLYWAKAVFIAFMVGLIMSYALSPMVNWMEARRIPRAAGAGLLLLGLFGAVGSTAYALSDEASKLVESLPAAAQKFRQTIKARQTGSTSTLDTVQKAAAQLEQVAQEANSPAARGGALRVVVEPPRFNITDYLWTGTLGLATLVGQMTVVVFLAYFLMVSGNTFRRKLIKLAGPSLSKKKVTLQALDEITGQIQRYLQVQLATSALVGVLTGLAFWAIGLENAAVWAIAAGVLNLVPYIGSLVTAVVSGGVAFLQFGSSNMALLVAGASLVIHTIVGNLITPWLTSRASRMNPVAVFVGLLAWGWLWGVWGLLLGLPILMIVKAVCDRVEDLTPVGEFLSA
jgi:predicted PurR-regulated permease PerM